MAAASGASVIHAPLDLSARNQEKFSAEDRRAKHSCSIAPCPSWLSGSRTLVRERLNGIELPTRVREEMRIHVPLECLLNESKTNMQDSCRT